MPADDSLPYLVARFLKANNYEETLNTFLAEASLPPDAGSIPRKDSLTLESLLEEKRAFDRAVSYSKTDLASSSSLSGWSSPAPHDPEIISSSANLLCASVANLHFGDSPSPRPILLASAADRSVKAYRADDATGGLLAELQELRTIPGLVGNGAADSPVLGMLALSKGKIVTVGMSGQVRVADARTGRIETRQDHRKYVVKATAYRNETEGTTWLATAAWDAKVLLYRIANTATEAASDADDITTLGAPVAEITLTTNPETVLFAKDPDTNRVFLLVSRRDSSEIYYHLLNSDAGAGQQRVGDPTSGATTSLLIPAGSQNLAPHSNAWVAFSPSSMSLSPTDPTLLAVATSSLPHMKAIIVRLLFPSDDVINGVQRIYTTQAEQARESLARQDREDLAIQVHVNTMAPQTPYSTPQVCWRPDGSGIFVNGDDGVIRGIEAISGKIVATMKNGHEAGSKIRSLWAGHVGESKQEWLISGGFDRRLIVWRPAKIDA